MEVLRTTEENGNVDEALERYAREIREAELFLAGQQDHAQQASYRKLAELLDQHKAFLAAVREGDMTATRSPAPPAPNEEEQQGTSKGRWVIALNELLRGSGEVRSLLRQGK